MSKQIVKNGKLPASAREEVDSFGLFEEMSMLDVDPAIKKHLEEAGNTLRWINASKFKLAGGFNSKGWKPVRVSDLPPTIAAGSGATYGSTAEGFLIRNDMMLAQRPKEVTEKHKAQLRAKAEMAASKTKRNAQAIKEALGGYGRVIEGYEDNSDD